MSMRYKEIGLILSREDCHNLSKMFNWILTHPSLDYADIPWLQEMECLDIYEQCRRVIKEVVKEEARE